MDVPSADNIWFLTIQIILHRLLSMLFASMLRPKELFDNSPRHVSHARVAMNPLIPITIKPTVFWLLARVDVSVCELT